MASPIGHSIEIPVRVKAVDVPINVVMNVALALEVEGQDQTNFDDVGDFHEKFGLGNVTHGEPGIVGMPADLFEFRLKFLKEELQEFEDAMLGGYEDFAFDALLDLVYVAMGTAHLLGFPWQEGWDLVQAANMAKERAIRSEQSARGSTWDVVKPEGWQPPDIKGLLISHGWPA